MKQTLQLKLSQHLTLTPQLQQSIRLLQLSTVELNAEVERMLQENPLLEKAEGDDEPLAAMTPLGGPHSTATRALPPSRCRASSRAARSAAPTETPASPSRAARPAASAPAAARISSP